MTQHSLPSSHAKDQKLLRQWLASHTAQTCRNYSADVQRLYSCLGAKPVNAITSEDLSTFRASIQRLQLRSQTRVLSSLRSLFHFGYCNGYLSHDLRQLLPLPRLSRAKTGSLQRQLSHQQVTKLIGSSSDPRTKAIVTLLYDGALNVSELCALKWNDIQDSSIHIRGRKGQSRVIPLTDTMRTAFQALPISRDRSCPVIPSKEKGHLDPSQLFRVVQQAGEKAGFKKRISPVLLRHAAVRRANKNGMRPEELQAWLGHSSVAATHRYLRALSHSDIPSG
jgi:site-specific recombinase XerD